MERERRATAVLLGLSGFVLFAVSEYDGELEQAVQTTADLVGCPGCGAVAAAHARRPVRVRLRIRVRRRFLLLQLHKPDHLR